MRIQAAAEEEGAPGARKLGAAVRRRAPARAASPPGTRRRTIGRRRRHRRVEPREVVPWPCACMACSMICCCCCSVAKSTPAKAPAAVCACSASRRRGAPAVELFLRRRRALPSPHVCFLRGPLWEASPSPSAGAPSRRAPRPRPRRPARAARVLVRRRRPPFRRLRRAGRAFAAARSGVVGGAASWRSIRRRTAYRLPFGAWRSRAQASLSARTAAAVAVVPLRAGHVLAPRGSRRRGRPTAAAAASASALRLVRGDARIGRSRTRARRRRARLGERGCSDTRRAPAACPRWRRARRRLASARHSRAPGQDRAVLRHLDCTRARLPAQGRGRPARRAASPRPAKRHGAHARQPGGHMRSRVLGTHRPRSGRGSGGSGDESPSITVGHRNPSRHGRPGIDLGLLPAARARALPPPPQRPRVPGAAEITPAIGTSPRAGTRPRHGPLPPGRLPRDASPASSSASPASCAAGPTCRSTCAASDASWWSLVTESPSPRSAARPMADAVFGPRSGGPTPWAAHRQVQRPIFGVGVLLRQAREERLGVSRRARLEVVLPGPVAQFQQTGFVFPARGELGVRRRRRRCGAQGSKNASTGIRSRSRPSSPSASLPPRRSSRRLVPIRLRPLSKASCQPGPRSAPEPPARAGGVARARARARCGAAPARAHLTAASASLLQKGVACAAHAVPSRSRDRRVSSASGSARAPPRTPRRSGDRGPGPPRPATRWGAKRAARATFAPS